MAICMKESVFSCTAYDTSYYHEQCALRYKIISFNIHMMSRHNPLNNNLTDHCSHCVNGWTSTTVIIDKLRERHGDKLELRNGHCIR